MQQTQEQPLSTSPWAVNWQAALTPDLAIIPPDSVFIVSTQQDSSMMTVSPTDEEMPGMALNTDNTFSSSIYAENMTENELMKQIEQAVTSISTDALVLQ